MGLDINTKKLKKNAFRVSKVRGIGASRIRVPGGYLNAEVLGMVQENRAGIRKRLRAFDYPSGEFEIEGHPL